MPPADARRARQARDHRRPARCGAPDTQTRALAADVVRATSRPPRASTMKTRSATSSRSCWRTPMPRSSRPCCGCSRTTTGSKELDASSCPTSTRSRAANVVRRRRPARRQRDLRSALARPHRARGKLPLSGGRARASSPESNRRWRARWLHVGARRDAAQAATGRAYVRDPSRGRARRVARKHMTCTSTSSCRSTAATLRRAACARRSAWHSW